MKKFLLLMLPFLLQSMFATAQVDYNVSLTVPYGDKVFVGQKTKHYVPFTEQLPVSVSEEAAAGKTTYLYNLTNGSNYSLKVSSTDNTAEAFKNHVTYAQKFSITATQGLDLDLTATDADGVAYLDVQAGEVKSYVNRDLQANKTYNVADVYVNGSYSGYNKLNMGDDFQIVNLRNWEIVDNVISNYFIEPDYHYTVLDENFTPSTSVVSVNEDGLVHAEANGTAIVLVTYDAMKAPQQVGGGDIFSSIWAENTGVMVFSVGAVESGIVPNMVINENVNTDATQKISTVNVDAELDVFYYVSGQQGFRYIFTPENVTKVEIANPVIDKIANTLTYAGFKEVKKNSDGSYALLLKEGRNIVRLSNANGAEYYVLRAKEVKMTITPDKDVYAVGDEVCVRFETLYHPVNKLAGVYNMHAQVKYNDSQKGEVLSATRVQYNFAANEKAQTLTFTLAETNADTYILDGGIIECTMFGDPYGGHREITYTDGKSPNFTASSRTASFGTLPVIALEMENGYNVKTIAEENDVVLDLADAVCKDTKEAIKYTDGGYWDRCYDIEPDAKVVSQIFTFAHKAEDWGDWGKSYNGYVPSVNGDASDYSNSAEGWYGTHEWGNMAGGGVKMADENSVYANSANEALSQAGSAYMVLYGSSVLNEPDGTAVIVMADEGTKIKGVYVALNPITYYTVMYGSAYSKPFENDGDFLDFTAVGYDKNGETGRVSMRLAEYDSNSGLQMSTKWQWLDLSSLGEVSKVDFCFNGSDYSEYSLNTPCYVCLDKLVATPAIGASVDAVNALQSVARVRNILYNVPENSDVYVYSIGGVLIDELYGVGGEVMLPVIERNMIIKVVSPEGIQVLR